MGIQPLTEVQEGLQGLSLEINTLSIHWLSLPEASQQRSLHDGLQVKPASRTQAEKDREQIRKKERVGKWRKTSRDPFLPRTLRHSQMVLQTCLLGGAPSVVRPLLWLSPHASKSVLFSPDHHCPNEQSRS